MLGIFKWADWGDNRPSTLCKKQGCRGAKYSNIIFQIIFATITITAKLAKNGMYF